MIEDEWEAWTVLRKLNGGIENGYAFWCKTCGTLIFLPTYGTTPHCGKCKQYMMPQDVVSYLHNKRDED